MMRLTFFSLHIIIILFVLLIQPAIGAEKRALLIGIDNYSLSSGFTNLKGVRNDIEIMKKVLEDKRFDFKHITILFNETATHSRIHKEFIRLSDKVNSDDIASVYIYYSGHGSQTRDLNGDEKQMKDLQGNSLPTYDQTWVTYGSRLKSNVPLPEGFMAIDAYDILDDQISEWLNEIASKCNQVVFVSDSCHSGSVSRGGIITGIRKGPIDTREHPLGRRNYKKIHPKNIIRVGASRDDQAAKEFLPKGSMEEYGLFTWYWVKALEKCRPNDSWSHVFNRVSRIVHQETPNRQNPQISGAVTMKVFGEDFLAPARTIPVYQVLNRTDEKEVYLSAGRLSGVTEGSVYTLEDNVGQPDPPNIIVKKVHPTQSMAVTKANVKVYDQLVEIYHHHQFPPTRLLIKAEHEKDSGTSLDEIRRVVGSMHPYTITTEDQACDLIVYLFRPEKSPLKADDSRPYFQGQMVPPRSNENAGAEIWILDNNGFLYRENLRHPYTSSGLAALRRNLLRLARMKDMLQVESPETKPPLDITITPMIPAFKTENAKCIPNDWPTETCPSEYYKILDPLPLPDVLRKKWDLCTIIQFNAKNSTATPYYFYVVSIGSQAEIEPVFPSLEDSSQIAKVNPGATNLGGAAVIRLDTKTLDHYKLIICKKPINHHLFFQPGFSAVARTKWDYNQLNPLEKILLDATAGTRSSVSYETGSWYAETLIVDMR